MSPKTFKFFIITLVLSGIILLQTISPDVQAQAPDPTAEQALQSTWELAKASATYRYYSEIEQTTYPAPRLTSAGQRPTIDIIQLDGLYDQVDEKLELTMWNTTAANTPSEAIEIRVDGTEAKGRRGTNGQWETLGTVNDFFAPGGDPLGFLSGATNIQYDATTDYNFGTSSIQHPTSNIQHLYTFDFSGYNFGLFVTDAFEKQLIANGELAPEVSLQISDVYKQMTGNGRIWIDAAGYPARIVLDLDLGRQQSGETVTAVVDINYSDFTAPEDHLTFWDHPQSWTAAQTADLLAKPNLANQIAVRIALLFFATAFIMITIRYWHTRAYYNGLVSLLVFSMLASPFLEVGRASAYSNRLAQRLDAAETSAPEHTPKEAIATYQQDQIWNPNQNPLNSVQSSVSNTPIHNSQFTIHNSQLLNANNVTTTIDTDGDGVNDTLELTNETCSGNPTNDANLDYCASVSDTTDSDGDGLSDGVEANQLGTFGDLTDSDGDTLADNLEVGGFSYNGQMWYLDPKASDTNKDGLIDSVECNVWVSSSDTYNPAAICPDTDGDLTPDVFDDDNDNDGVIDSRDLSPFSASPAFDSANPFELQIDNLTLDKPVLVSLQIRPTNPDHLTYIGNVLDWPAPDTNGQVQRRLNTTFANTSNIDLRSNGFNADYGDMRLTPLLEITMPVSPDHYANLPITNTAPLSRTPVMTVTDWLDTSQTDPYGISVMDTGQPGQLSAFVPLTIDTDDSGGGRVAFSTQMLYRPNQGSNGTADWGAAHQFRLIWMVQMLTETCTDPADNATCTEKMAVVHIYDDEWQLTGLDVREDHGLDVAILYEDPAADTERQMEDSLWQISWGLNNTFMRGRDCDSLSGANNCTGNDQRDVTIANINGHVASWQETDQPVTVAKFNYDHAGYISKIMMEETPAILDTHFASYANEMNPTLLIAREETFRGVGLDQISANGTLFTADLNPADIKPQVLANMSWGPFSYNNSTSAWESGDVIDYVKNLEQKLQNIPFFEASATATGTAEEAKGRIVLAQQYYLALYQGVNALVEADGTPVWGPSQDYPEIYYGTPTPGGTFTGPSYLAFSVAETLYNTLKNRPSGERFINQFIKELGHAYSSLSTGGISQLKFSQLTRAERAALTSTNVALSITTAASIVGMGLYAAGYLTGDSNLLDAGVITMNAATAVVSTSVIASNAYRLHNLGQLMRGTNFIPLTKLQQFAPIKALSTGTIILQFAVIWGFFAWQASSLSRNSVQYNVAVANAVAQTIVALLFVVLVGIINTILVALAVSAPGFGTAIVLLIYLIDALIYLITYALGKPFSVLQTLTEAIADALYDVNMVIPNLGPNGRLEFVPDVTLVDPRKGFAIDNSVILTMSITNTVGYNNRYDFARASQSAYTYRLSPVEKPNPSLHSQLNVGDTAALWTSLPNATMRYTDAITRELALADAGLGRDRNFNNQLYLIEGFAVQYQGCWQLVFDELCQWYELKESIPVNVGAGQIYDVFPLNLTQFYSLNGSDSTGYELAWLSYASAITQTAVAANPILVDADNDGLKSRAAQGADPNDSRWDTDGDGLGDNFEIGQGLDPTQIDTDGDGLSDADELRYGTNPTNPDTDGDGLHDKLEVVDGWIIAYDGGTTRVWSDPRHPDIDGDKLSDLEEYMFGFNPYVATDPSLIDTLIQFDDFGVQETSAPILFMPFEETNTDTYGDLSGNNIFATCDDTANACPSSTNGRFGNALLFDGNDSLTANFGADVSQFTIGAWIYNSVDDDNYHGIMGGDYGTGLGQRAPSMWVYQRTRIHAAFGFGSSQAPILTGNVLTQNQWQHVAVTFDGNAYRVYVDGVEVYYDDSHAGRDPVPFSSYTLGRVGNQFEGRIDEAIFYDRALSVAEIQNVMHGRYNVNDTVFAPNDTFSYQTTVTNTTGARDASGLLVGRSTYANPALPTPRRVFNFEPEQHRRVFIDQQEGNDTVSCAVTLGTCPTVTAGIAQFDGVDDILTLGAVYPNNQYTSFTMTLKVDQLPPAGETMALLSTDSTNSEAVSLYLRSDGKVVMEHDGANGRVLSNYAFTNDSPWVTLRYNFGFNSQGGGTKNTLLVNGVWDAESDFYSGSLAFPFFGPGHIGGGTAGTVPFAGQIDGFSVFHWIGQASGSYTIGANNYRRVDNLTINFSKTTERFENSLNRSGFEAFWAECVAPHTCPAPEPNGKFGSSAKFTAANGSDLPQLALSALDFSAQDFTISGWFKAVPNQPARLFTGSDGLGGFEELTLDLSSDAGAYKLTVVLVDAGENDFVVMRSSIPYTSAEWVHVALTRSGNQLALYQDGQQVATAVFNLPLPDSLPAYFGANCAGCTAYPLELDDWVIFDEALPADDIVALTSGTYPAVAVNEGFVEFAVPAQSSVTAAGTGYIPDGAPTSYHYFEETADVAFDITIPTVLNDPLDNTNLRLYTPFEEPPGYIGAFDNPRGEYSPVYSPGRVAQLRCYTEADCPTTGIRGRNGRAVYFNGQGQRLTSRPDGYLNTTEAFYTGTFAAWVKPENGIIMDIMEYDYFLPMPIRLKIDMSGLELLNGGCDIGSAYNISAPLPQNEWSFVTLVIQPYEFINDGVTITHIYPYVKYYINGQLAGEIDLPDADCIDFPAGYLILGGDAARAQGYTGYLDEVRTYGTVMTDAQVQTLYDQSAPLMHFEFDEDENASVFMDSSSNGYVGIPAQKSAVVDGISVVLPNPALGSDGKIGNVATFDGTAYITVANADRINNLGNNFTAMAWVKWEDPGTHSVLFGHGRDTNDGWSVGVAGNGALQLILAGVDILSSPAGTLTPNIWQHVAVSFDSTNKAHFYVNGQLVSSSASTWRSAFANSGEPFYIGVATWAGNKKDFFKGQMDELLVYDKLFTQAEINNIYLRDLRWYRDRASQLLTIDTNAPTIELVTNQTYYPNVYNTLVVNTTDLTSIVTLLDVGIKGPNDAAFNWQSAPPCQDGTFGRAWCPPFDPTTLGGEGTYELQFRAVDQVGHETTSPIHTVYVDDSTPAAIANHSGELGTLTPNIGQSHSWTTTLNGYVSDLSLPDGTAGSGVLDGSVYVGLRGADGRLLSDNIQPVNLNGYSWSVEFAIVAEQPVGLYEIELRATDAVGNEFNSVVGTIRFDTQPPNAAVDQLTAPAYISTTAATITGNADDGAGLGVQSVEVRLEPFAAPAPSGQTADVAQVTWQPTAFNNGQWSYTFPSVPAGFYELRLRSTDSAGNTAEQGIHWRGLIDQTAPTITASGSHIGGNSAPETEYTFTLSDFILNDSSLSQPCGAGNLVSLTYSHANRPEDGLPYEISGTCRVSGHETSRNFTACDAAGNCTTETATPTAGSTGNILITTPAFGSQFIENATINFSGGAYDPTAISSIMLYANGSEIATASYSGNDTNWSASWSTPVIDTYLIEAVMVGNSGTYTDSITIDVLQDPLDDLFVTVNGTGSGLVTSTPAGIACGSDCTERYPNSIEVTLTASANTGSTFVGWSGMCSGTGSCTVTVSDVTNVTATFMLNSYDLTVSKNGAGVGTVTSTPTGIDCGLDCVETLTHSSVITLTATAGLDSLFSGWSGACSGTGVCVVTMDAAKSVTANFALNQYDLTTDITGDGNGTITSNPAGIDCGTDCNQSYAYNTAVSLSAAPDDNSVFTGWQGDCSGQICSLTVDTTKVVTATFAQSTYDLNVSVEGDGSDAATVTSNPAGITCGVGNANCQQTFNYNSVVTLTASYDNSQMALVWGGACGSATGDSCTIMINQLRDVTATFTRGLFSLGTNIAGNGNGSVVSVPAGISCDQDGGSCSGAFRAGEAITLTATAGAESQFSGWSGLCSGTADCQITLEQTEQVTATFALNQYDLTVSKTGNGVGTITSDPGIIDCGSSCSAALNYGTVVTLTAAAETESQFMGWLGACSGTADCVVTVDQAKSVTAHFALNKYALDVLTSGNGGGLVTSTPLGIGCGADCTELYPFGTVVTLTTTANSGSIFTGWSGACTGNESCVVNINQAKSVTATFTLITHTLTVNTAGTGVGKVTSQPTGINCGGICTADYGHNTLVTLTATPQTGSSFTGWSSACTGTGNCIVTMDMAQQVTATFNLITTTTPTYTLSVTLVGDGIGRVLSDPAGIECGVACSADYAENTVVTLTASSAAGSFFAGWSGACFGTGSCSMTMSQAQTVTADFTSTSTSNEYSLFLPLIIR